MSEKVSVDELQRALKEYLEDYEEDIFDSVKEVTDSITKKAVKDLKNASPSLTGSYAKGWQKQKGKVNKNSKYTVKIHNKTDYQLTHLLEFGHASRNGSWVNARPHIREIEEKYKKEYGEELTTVIRRRSKK